MNCLNATDLYLKLYLGTVQANIKMLNRSRLADKMFAALHLSINVNATELSLALIQEAAAVLLNMIFYS